MGHIIEDRIKEISTTTGTGTITLGGTVLGSRTFGSVMSDSDTCYYCIDDAFGNWEIGLGTYSSNTLARSSVFKSSNAGSLVDFPAGAKGVFITNPASNIPLITSGTFTPVLRGNTVAGIGTYTTQTGYYTINGKVLSFWLDLKWTAHTGSGTMSITGLPLAATQKAVFPLIWDTLTFTGVPAGQMTIGSGVIDIVSAASAAALAGVTMDTTAAFAVSGSYLIS